MSVLIVSPFAEDHALLGGVLAPWAVPVRNASTCAEAHQALCTGSTALVICEETLEDGDWRTIVDETSLWPLPPLAIVISRFADERLWSEVLNLGVYDLLLKPLDPAETERVIASACRRIEPATVATSAA